MIPKRVFRLLLIEDDPGRVEYFRFWLPPEIQLVWARSGGNALGIIQRDPGYVYGGVLLDHDLQQQIITSADKSLSGSNVVAQIINHFSTDIPILVHSTNQVEGPQMVRSLEQAGFWVSHIPMYHMDKVVFNEWLEAAIVLWEDHLPV